jgi:hypothetical protein
VNGSGFGSANAEPIGSFETAPFSADLIKGHKDIFEAELS